MCKEAGAPVDGEAMQPVDPVNIQDVFTYKILAMLDQARQKETFGAENAVSEPQEELGFSRSFMDNMRAMVAEHYGPEAAERFMAHNSNQIKNMCHPSPKEVSESEKAMSHASATEDAMDTAIRAIRPRRKHIFKIFTGVPAWTRKAAAVLIAVGLIFGGYQVSVQAFRLPTVNHQAQDKGDYSQIGSLEDVISNLELTAYPQTLECIYMPAIVADGYEEVDKVIASKALEVYYEDGSGKKYEYYQYTIDTSMYFDTEFSSGKEIEVNDCFGYMEERETENNLWWMDYNYIYQLAGNLSEEEMIVIAESLYRVDND
jgi:hypothetical protein